VLNAEGAVGLGSALWTHGVPLAAQVLQPLLHRLVQACYVRNDLDQQVAARRHSRAGPPGAEAEDGAEGKNGDGDDDDDSFSQLHPKWKQVHEDSALQAHARLYAYACIVYANVRALGMHRVPCFYFRL
jgi:hypothetical protein